MIKKSENIKKFEDALSADENLRNKYEAAFKKIADEKLAESDGEAMVKAAKELGFEISIDEMERAFAAIQELDDDELSDAAGGRATDDRECRFESFKHTGDEDEKGHSGFCLVLWHCFTAFIHTETDSKKVVCWKSYLCDWINN